MHFYFSRDSPNLVRERRERENERERLSLSLFLRPVLQLSSRSSTRSRSRARLLARARAYSRHTACSILRKFAIHYSLTLVNMPHFARRVYLISIWDEIKFERFDFTLLVRRKFWSTMHAPVLSPNVISWMYFYIYRPDLPKDRANSGRALYRWIFFLSHTKNKLFMYQERKGWIAEKKISKLMLYDDIAFSL